MTDSVQIKSDPVEGEIEVTPPRVTSRLAVASLACGMLGLSLLAVIFGHLALSRFKRNDERLWGRELAVGGLIIGYLGLAVTVLVIIMMAADG